MLRIKDNVDLKELEKFGFYKSDLTESYIKTIQCKNKKDKNIIFVNDSRYLHKIKKSYIVSNLCSVKTIQVRKSDLKDLIQAGLVEKVKECEE